MNAGSGRCKLWKGLFVRPRGSDLRGDGATAGQILQTHPVGLFSVWGMKISGMFTWKVDTENKMILQCESFYSVPLKCGRLIHFQPISRLNVGYAYSLLSLRCNKHFGVLGKHHDSTCSGGHKNGWGCTHGREPFGCLGASKQEAHAKLNKTPGSFNSWPVSRKTLRVNFCRHRATCCCCSQKTKFTSLWTHVIWFPLKISL